MAQERYLSPKEILSYLCDLERKLPNRVYHIYIPSHRHDFGEVTPEVLNDECQLMLNFVGLDRYISNVKFAMLDANVAGCTTPGDTSNNVLSISVSSTMKNDWSASLATLAHEICHHVIYMNGIRPNIGWMTEAFTDLCTLYTGFGQLVLDGYKTNKHTLGYLDWDTYEVTNHIVNVVLGNVSSSNTGYAGRDIFADNAIKIWESEENRNSAITQSFERQSARLADTLYKIDHLENLLNIFRDHSKAEIQQLSQSFASNRLMMADGYPNKIAAFSLLYDTYISIIDKEEDNNDRVMEAALFNLFMEAKKRYGTVVLNREIVCPCCGKRFKNIESNFGTKIIKCQSCNNYFVVNTNEWNPTKVQRKEELNRIEKRKRQEEELEAYRIKINAEEKAAAWKDAKKMEKELSDLHNNIASLPVLIRWIVKQHINKNN